MKKRLILVVLLLTLIFSGNAMVMEVDGEENINGFDTLSFSQDDYQNILINSEKMSEDNQIKNICESFIASSRAYVRKPSDYSNSVYLDKNRTMTAQVEYRLSEYDYLNSLYNALDWKITSDSIVFDKFSVEINNDNAYASIVESYTYDITDGFKDNSFRRREYTFTLSKGDEGWRITNVTTNDPWESNKDFNYEAIDVESVVLTQVNQKSSFNPILQNDIIHSKDLPLYGIESDPLYVWNYDTDDAVDYAEDHYDDTSNSVFGFSSGVNCQNFASQCVWAGLGGSGSSTTAAPAVPTQSVGSDAWNVWSRNQSTTYYTYTPHNWAWDNVKGFAKLMERSTQITEGPYGDTYYSNAIEYAQVGNVLSYDAGGSPAADTVDHAMFVTEVSGTSGSRTTSEVKIACHTSPSNSAYETLSSYASYSSSYFARSVILRGYYQ